MVRAIRAFFDSLGYVELFTPTLTRAPAPEPYIDPFGVEGGLYLITSPELNIKRIMAETGLRKVYQIGPVFRRGERGHVHNPEFLMLEWYTTCATYMDLMEQCEALFDYVSRELEISFGRGPYGEKVSLSPPFLRLSVKEAFQRFCDRHPDPFESFDPVVFDRAMVDSIEPALSRLDAPVFLYDWPRERASLSKLKQGELCVAERVELYGGGLELGNGFTELTDPLEQAKRFKEMMRERLSMGKGELPWPQDFLDSLKDLPPCAGMAFGIDRFLMLLTGAQEIADVLAYPVERA